VQTPRKPDLFVSNVPEAVPTDVIDARPN
jgi:hypothetical protein